MSYWSKPIGVCHSKLAEPPFVCPKLMASLENGDVVLVT